jgi:hypothetical protein
LLNGNILLILADIKAGAKIILYCFIEKLFLIIYIIVHGEKLYSLAIFLAFFLFLFFVKSRWILAMSTFEVTVLGNPCEFLAIILL